MKGSRFKSAVRSILDYVGEGLMWMGVPFGMSAEVAAEISTSARLRAGSTNGLDNVWLHPDQLYMAPLSKAESAVWADLVERLR